VVEIKAAETFANLVLREGVELMDLALGDRRRVFTCDRLLDMRRLKTRGIIGSYKITRIVKTERTIEKG
jgi:hypothetical protein